MTTLKISQKKCRHLTEKTFVGKEKEMLKLGNYMYAYNFNGDSY